MAYEIHRLQLDRGSRKWASGSVYGAHYSLGGIGKLKESIGKDTLDDCDSELMNNATTLILYTGYGFRNIGAVIPLREIVQTDCITNYPLIQSGSAEIILSGSDDGGWKNWLCVGSVKKVKEIMGTDVVEEYDVSIQSESIFILSSSTHWPVVGKTYLYSAE